MGERQAALKVGDRVEALGIDTFSGGAVVSIGGLRALLPAEYVGEHGRVHPSDAVGRRMTVEVLAVAPEESPDSEDSQDSSGGVRSRPPIVSERHAIRFARELNAASAVLTPGQHTRGAVVHVTPTALTLDCGGRLGTLDLRDVAVGEGYVLTHGSQVGAVGDEMHVEVAAVETGRCILRANLPPAATAPTRRSLQRLARRVLSRLVHASDTPLAAETVELIGADARLLGVLTGECATYALPSVFVAQSPSRVETDLAFLAQRLRLITGYGYAITLVQQPAGDGRPSVGLMFSNVTVIDRLPEGRQVLRPLSRFRDVWCGPRFGGGAPARKAAESHSCEHEGEVAPLDVDRFEAIQHGTASLPGLALVGTTGDTDVLVEALDRWAENADLFGHPEVHVTIVSTGNPGLIAECLEAWRSSHPQTRLRVEVAVPAEVDVPQGSDKGRAPLDVALRNHALQTLSGPLLVTDAAAIPSIRTMDHATLRAIYVANGKMPPEFKVAAQDVEIDVLGACALCAPTVIGSPVTTGQRPAWPDDRIASAFADSSDQGATESAEPDHGMVVADISRGVDVIEQALFRGAAAYAPAQPLVLDGDEISVATLAGLGNAPAPLPTALLRLAGRTAPAELSPPDAWALLYDATLSQLVWRTVRAALSGVRGDRRALSLQLSECLSEETDRGLPSTLVERLWRPRLQETLELARGGQDSVGPAFDPAPWFPKGSLEGTATLAALFRPAVEATVKSYAAALIDGA